MAGTTPVGTYAKTASTGSGGTTPAVWFAQSDANSAALMRPGDNFAPHPAATPAMSVVLDAGFIVATGASGWQHRTEVAQQTAVIAAAPAAPNSRIDLVVIDAGTGAASVIAGTPSTTPAAPSVTAGKMAVALVSVLTGVTAIGASAITDIRAVWSSGVPGVPWAVGAGTADAITAAYTPATAVLYDGLMLAVRAPGANTVTAPTFAPDGLVAHPITKAGGTALVAGDIPGNFAECLLRFNIAYERWELLNPAAQLSAAEIEAALGFTPQNAASPAGSANALATGVAIEVSSLGCTGAANFTGTMSGTSSGYTLNYDGLFPFGGSGWCFAIGGPSGSGGPYGGAYSVSLYAEYGVVGGGFFALSDARVKSDLKPITPEQGRRFVEVSLPLLYVKDGREEAGFLAQDQHKAGYSVALTPHPGLPETVDEDGYVSPADMALSIPYSERIAFLTAALKDAFARIRVLEERGS